MNPSPSTYPLRCVAVLYLLMIFQAANAQVYGLLDEFEILNPGKPMLNRFAGELNDYTYYLEGVPQKKLGKVGHQTDMYLCQYDTFSTLTGKQLLGVNDVPWDPDIEYSAVVGGQLYIFNSVVDKKKETKTLFAEAIDPVSLVRTGFKKTLIISSFEGSNAINSGQYLFEISPDGRNLLILRNNPFPFFKKGAKEAYELYVFDEQLNLLKNGAHMLDIADRDYTVRFINLDNTGKIVVIGKTPGSDYLMYSHSTPVDKPQMDTVNFRYPHIAFQFKDFIITDSSIINTGYFSDFSRDMRSGCHLLEYNYLDRRFTKNWFSYFSEKPDKEAVKQTPPIPNVNLLRFWTWARDRYGNWYICGDYKSSQTVEFYKSSGPYDKSYMTSVEVDYYGDISVIRMDTTGKITWWATIPRNKKIIEKTMKDPNLFATQYIFTYKGRVGVLYNERPENLLKDKLDMQKENWSSAVLCLAIIEPDGTLSRKALTQEQGYVGRLGKTKLMNGQLLISLAYWKDENKLNTRRFSLEEIMGD
jgi:hypothetical protein